MAFFSFLLFRLLYFFLFLCNLAFILIFSFGFAKEIFWFFFLYILLLNFLSYDILFFLLFLIFFLVREGDIGFDSDIFLQSSE